jgi:hypothetical protein
MELTPFSSVDRSAFRWLRDREHPAAFSLLSGDRAVATLEWKAKGGSLATVQSVSDLWTLKRGGFLNPHITVRNQERLAARLSVHMNHHQIDVVGGRSYRFHRAGILLPAWEVTTPAGKEILHVEPAREGRHLRAGAVVVAPEATELSDLLLLMVLSWYFIVLAWFEDEAVETLAPLEGPDAPATLSSQ